MNTSPGTAAARTLGAVLVLLLCTETPGALAQQPMIEEIVVTGTRRAGLAPTETLSPVDVIGGEHVAREATFDLTDSLSRLAPSLNTQRFPIADGTALIRPVTLRNLSPDHTLVLMNGTRRHRSALVNLQLAPLGTVNQGAQAVDWSAFPAAAIERVEILRDGASAQYGSDAIAGVINVILRDAREGASVSAQYGQYYEGDGERLSVSGNIGLPLTERGFVNLTGEYSTTETTSRGGVHGAAEQVGAFLGDPTVVPLGGVGQRWGDPEIDAFKVLVNAGFDISDTLQAYGFGTFMNNDTESDFFYRNPVLPPEAGVAARTTLQIDTTGDFLPDPAPQSLVDAIQAQGLLVDDFLDADAASASGYVLRNPIHTQFPAGYTPVFGASIRDRSLVLGLRGDAMPNLSFDVRGRYGESELDYEVSNTINPSLGRLSPLSFKPGTLTQTETSLNLDMVRTFDDAPLNVAFGGELRRERYEIDEGDPASILAGPTAAIFGVGSDGFQGFPTESAGSFDSDSWAVYLDVETDLTDQLSGAVAFRFEDYDDFDNTFDWKVAARYQFSEALAVRGTYNTGFRTPTPGQVHTLNITTTSDPEGNLIPSGTYPVSHPVAVALGASPLQAEESRSFTVGIVATPFVNTSLTVDLYRIEIDDRLALLDNTIGPDELAALIAAGVPNAELLSGSNVNFFVNAFDSEVTGIDIAIQTTFEDIVDGRLTVGLRHNWNDQDVSNVTPGTINASRVFDLENQVPNHRTVLSFDYLRGDLFEGMLRLNYFGDWKTTGGLFSPGDASDRYSYDGKVLVDLEFNLNFLENYRLTLGGANIFDTMPGAEQEPVLQFLGVRRSLTSPFGFNGGFWYIRLSAFL
jgi:iron complex outermembrane recepter protein